MHVKILIVEDNQPKGDEIATIIRSRYDAEFEFVPSIAGAYAVLEHKGWDLVILDMTFQVSMGVGQTIRKEALAGVELLQYMAGKGIAYPVIVATQHAGFAQGSWINLGSVGELHALLAKTFPNIYRHTVRVDLATTNWHSELLAAVEQVFDVQRTQNISNRRLT